MRTKPIRRAYSSGEVSQLPEGEVHRSHLEAALTILREEVGDRRRSRRTKELHVPRHLVELGQHTDRQLERELEQAALIYRAERRRERASHRSVATGLRAIHRAKAAAKGYAATLGRLPRNEEHVASARREFNSAMADLGSVTLCGLTLLAAIPEREDHDALCSTLAILRGGKWTDINDVGTARNVERAIHEFECTFLPADRIPDPTKGGRTNFYREVIGKPEFRFVLCLFFIFERISPGEATRAENGPWHGFAREMFACATGQIPDGRQIERYLRAVTEWWGSIERKRAEHQEIAKLNRHSIGSFPTASARA